MPWKLTDEGYEQDDKGDRGSIPTMPGLFSIANMIRSLSNLCWSVAHIASHLGISQNEVRSALKSKK